MQDGTFAARLRAAREMAGDLSGRELARLAGLRSETTVGLAEIGHTHSVRIESGIAIATVLGVEVKWLVSGTGTAPTVETVRAAVAAARERHDAIPPTERAPVDAA